MKNLLLGIALGAFLVSPILLSFDDSFLITKDLDVEADREDVIADQYSAGESISSAELNFKIEALNKKINANKVLADTAIATASAGGALCEGSAVVTFTNGSVRYKFDACKMKGIWDLGNGVNLYGSWSFGFPTFNSRPNINSDTCVGAGGIMQGTFCHESSSNLNVNASSIVENGTSYSNFADWKANTKARVDPYFE